MDVQTIIVGLILLCAAAYAARVVAAKAKSFSGKDGSCGGDCGCGPATGKIRRK